MTQRARADLALWAALPVLAGLPLLSLWGHPGAALADPLGELPVKLWLVETFAEVGWLGGRVDSVGFPGGGVLNNPEPLGTALTALLRPALGRAGAWNALVYVQLLANAAAMAWLARRRTGSAPAALLAAVAYALTPLALVYGVAGAVSDVLHLWPWPLALGLLLTAIERGGAWRPALLGGLLAGLGAVASPYQGVVHAALVFPGALWLLLAGRGLGVGPAALLRVGFAALLGAALLAGPYAAWTARLLAAPDSLVSTADLGATRHVAPFLDLRPQVPDRYTAYLADWVAVGRGALVERELAARFLRAFSPGLLVLGLALVGLLRGRGGLVWGLGAAFAVLASTGPFLPVHGGLALPWPANPAWLLPHHLLPSADLLLEPFRYAFPAVLCLAVLAALGAARLAPALGRALWALPALVVAELVLISPVPVPLPVAPVAVPAVYAALPLPAGALLELPYFDGDTDRFVRAHFLHQRVHGRPIPDAVPGFPPPWLVANGFTSRLLAVERTGGPLAVAPTGDPGEGLAALRAAGFAGIVVEPARYASPAVAASVRARLDAALGLPLERDGRWIYALR